MAHVRRMALILALVLGAVAAGPTGPAGAHAIVNPNEIPVDTPITINFSVVADLPVTMVEIAFVAPPQFEVSEVGRVPGWETTVEGRNIRLTGSAPSGTFVVVPISGRATEKAQLRFDLIETGEDGSTLEYTEDGFGGMAAPVVFAGLEFDDAGTAAGEESEGDGGMVPILAGAALFVALAGAGVWFVRRRPDLPSP